LGAAKISNEVVTCVPKDSFAQLPLSAQSCSSLGHIAFLEPVVETLFSRQFIQNLVIAAIFGNNQPASPYLQQ